MFQRGLFVCVRLSWAVRQPLVFGGTCEERSSQLPHPSTENTEENKTSKEMKTPHDFAKWSV